MDRVVPTVIARCLAAAPPWNPSDEGQSDPPYPTVESAIARVMHDPAAVRELAGAVLSKLEEDLENLAGEKSNRSASRGADTGYFYARAGGKEAAIRAGRDANECACAGWILSIAHAGQNLRAHRGADAGPGFPGISCPGTNGDVSIVRRHNRRSGRERTPWRAAFSSPRGLNGGRRQKGMRRRVPLACGLRGFAFTRARL